MPFTKFELSDFHLTIVSLISSSKQLTTIKNNVELLSNSFDGKITYEDIEVLDSTISVFHPIYSKGLGRIYITPKNSNDISNIRIIFSSSVPYDAQCLINFKTKPKDVKNLIQLFFECSNEVIEILTLLGLNNNITEFWQIKEFEENYNFKKWLEENKNFIIDEFKSHFEIESACLANDNLIFKCTNNSYLNELFICFGISTQNILSYLTYLPIAKQALINIRNQLKEFHNDQSLSTSQSLLTLSNLLNIKLDELIVFRKDFFDKQNILFQIEEEFLNSKVYIDMYISPLRGADEVSIINLNPLLKRELVYIDNMLIKPINEMLEPSKNKLQSKINLLSDAISVLNISIGLKIQILLKKLQWTQLIIALVLLLITILPFLKSIFKYIIENFNFLFYGNSSI